MLSIGILNIRNQYPIRVFEYDGYGMPLKEYRQLTHDGPLPPLPKYQQIMAEVFGIDAGEAFIAYALDTLALAGHRYPVKFFKQINNIEKYVNHLLFQM